MELKKLLETKPEELASIQYRELKKYALSILEEISDKLEKDDLKGVKNMLAYSPSGDCMGTDVYYLYFSEIEKEGDFGQLLNYLSSFSRIKEGGEGYGLFMEEE